MPAPRRALGRRGFAACRRPPRGAWHPTPCQRLRSALHGPWRGLEGALPGLRQSTWGVPPRSPAFSSCQTGRRGTHATAWGPQARGIWGCHPLPGSRQQAAGGTPCREAAQRTRQLGAMVAPLGGAIDGGRVGAPRGGATWAQPGSGVVAARRWPRARSFFYKTLCNTFVGVINRAKKPMVTRT